MFLFLITSHSALELTLERAGHYMYTGSSSSAYNFVFPNSSLSAQFLFQTNNSELIAIEPANISLPKPFFLYESSGNFTLVFSDKIDFSVWLFPHSLCDSKISVFGTSSDSRFRLHYYKSEERRCFFTVNHDFDVSFINFMRPVPDRSKPVLYGYTNETLVSGDSWYDGTDEMPRMRTDLPFFFGFVGATDESEWALNINFTTIDPVMNATCLFQETLIFNDVNFSATSDSGIEHITICRIEPPQLMWLYVLYSVFCVVIISIVVLVGYCNYKDYKQENYQTEESVHSIYSPLRGSEDLGSRCLNSPSLY